jgi:hypothetical protein
VSCGNGIDLILAACVFFEEVLQLVDGTGDISEEDRLEEVERI